MAYENPTVAAARRKRAEAQRAAELAALSAEMGPPLVSGSSYYGPNYRGLEPFEGGGYIVDSGLGDGSLAITQGPYSGQMLPKATDQYARDTMPDGMAGYSSGYPTPAAPPSYEELIWGEIQREAAEKRAALETLKAQIAKNTGLRDTGIAELDALTDPWGAGGRGAAAIQGQQLAGQGKLAQGFSGAAGDLRGDLAARGMLGGGLEAAGRGAIDTDYAMGLQQLNAGLEMQRTQASDDWGRWRLGELNRLRGTDLAGQQMSDVLAQTRAGMGMGINAQDAILNRAAQAGEFAANMAQRRGEFAATQAWQREQAAAEEVWRQRQMNQSGLNALSGGLFTLGGAAVGGAMGNPVIGGMVGDAVGRMFTGPGRSMTPGPALRDDYDSERYRAASPTSYYSHPNRPAGLGVPTGAAPLYDYSASSPRIESGGSNLGYSGIVPKAPKWRNR